MARKRGASGGTPATAALTAAGTWFELHPYEHDPRATSYGEEAATLLGVDPARVLKTIVVEADGELCVGVVPVAGTLDLKAIATALGARKVRLAEVAAAERSTGYVVGGISPIGQKRRLRTVVDTGALDHATVLVSGGRRGLDLELRPGDLIAVTEAIVAAVARD
ncbi:MAG TPA: Cys-tRNA(Pro) deacylase [Nocardioides sp.]